MALVLEPLGTSRLRELVTTPCE